MIGFEVATIHRYANASGTIVSQATGYEKFANDMKYTRQTHRKTRTEIGFLFADIISECRRRNPSISLSISSRWFGYLY